MAARCGSASSLASSGGFRPMPVPALFESTRSRARASRYTSSNSPRLLRIESLLPSARNLQRPNHQREGPRIGGGRAEGEAALLLDIADLEPGAQIRTPVCIVGAGAAGITLATKLAGRGIDVVLLESGGLDLEPEIQALHHGEAAGAEYPPLDAVRLRYIGGTTNHWGGQSLPLDPEDFEARAWVPDSGWPIAHREYARYLDEARALCEIGSGSFDYREVARERTLAPFPPLTGFEPVVLRFSPPTRFGIRYRPALEAD